MKHLKDKERIGTSERLVALLRTGDTVFHIGDLRNVWGISGNTLRVLISRLLQRGVLHPVYRGMYSLTTTEHLPKDLVAYKVAHGPSYITTETVLSREGIVLQNIPPITLVGTRSHTVSIGELHVKVRKLADEYLYNDAGVAVVNGVRYATVPRAIADMLYFNPTYYFDASKQIDWDSVRAIQRMVGYPISDRMNV